MRLAARRLVFEAGQPIAVVEAMAVSDLYRWAAEWVVWRRAG